MNIQPISEQAHNQAMMTLTAERQELMYYREAVPQLEAQNKELTHALENEVVKLEQSEMAHDSARLLNEQLQTDIKDKDVEIRQLQAKLNEYTELGPVLRKKELEQQLEQERIAHNAQRQQTALLLGDNKFKDAEIAMLKEKVSEAGIVISSWNVSEYYAEDSKEDAEE